MAEGSGKAREIDLGDNFGDVIVKANGARIEVGADSHVIVNTRGGVELQKAANDEVELGCIGAPEPKSSPKIGDVESAGQHKGEIYGGILPSDNKPIWFSVAPKLMDHYAAAAWAEGKGGSLPTRKQGDYLTTLKSKGGAFTEIFNRGGSFPAGYLWLGELYTNFRNGAWFQRLSIGDHYHTSRYIELPVLCVRR